MKIEAYRVIFKNGFVNGKRFVAMEDEVFLNPREFVSILKGDKDFTNKDIETFFALPSKGLGGSIIWTIDQESKDTFKFFKIDDLDPSLQDGLKKRNSDLLSDLTKFTENKLGKKNSTTTLAQNFEALEEILRLKNSMELVAGYNPSDGSYFPVVVGWGGELLDEKIDDASLKTSVEKKEKPAHGKQGASNTQVEEKPEDKHFRHFVERPLLFWLLWTLIFFLILLISFLVIPACGIKNILNTCERDHSEFRIYQSKITEMTDKLNFEANLCKSRFYTSEVSGDQSDEAAQYKELDQVIEQRLNHSEGTKSNLMAQLVWNSTEDLDLKIICPDGKYVNYIQRLVETNSCGTLDVDANVFSKHDHIINEPVENIHLKPLMGNYKIEVRSVENSNSVDIGTSFKVRIMDFGKEKIFSGNIRPSERKLFSFER
jgi:hypothetical protein